MEATYLLPPMVIRTKGQTMSRFPRITFSHFRGVNATIPQKKQNGDDLYYGIAMHISSTQLSPINYENIKK
jgi:hypothetical protein